MQTQEHAETGNGGRAGLRGSGWALRFMADRWCRIVGVGCSVQVSQHHGSFRDKVTGPSSRWLPARTAAGMKRTIRALLFHLEGTQGKNDLDCLRACIPPADRASSQDELGPDLPCGLILA